MTKNAHSSISQNIFGTRLREARIAVGLPQDKLGVLVGLDESTASTRISRYEAGIHEPPFSFAQRLAEVLHVPTAYFFATDDTLAGLIVHFSKLNKSSKAKLIKYLSEL